MGSSSSYTDSKMVENPEKLVQSCPATNPLSWTSCTAHANSFGSVFPSSLGREANTWCLEKKHFNKKSPNFIPIPISIKVQSSRISSTFEVFGSNFLGPPQKQHVLPRCNENCLLGRTTWCLKMEGSQNSVSLIGKSHAPLPFWSPWVISVASIPHWLFAPETRCFQVVHHRLIGVDAAEGVELLIATGHIRHGAAHRPGRPGASSQAVGDHGNVVMKNAGKSWKMRMKRGLGLPNST